jgi:hypothetical protein
MIKKLADLTDPRTLARDLFRQLGGMVGMAKWGKTHRSQAYQLIAKLMAQPMVQVNNKVDVNVAGEEARANLEAAFYRIIDARKNSVGDPAVYVNGERLHDDDDKEWIKKGGVIIDGKRLIEHQPVADVEPPQTPDAGVASGSNSENLKSPKSGPPFDGSRVGGAAGAGQKTKISMNSTLPRMPSVPGLFAGAALDESSDNRSTTEKYLSWTGHGRPP